MRTFVMAATLLGVAGCPQNTITFQGEELHTYFPFTGERLWLYESTDTSLPYRLSARLLNDSELLDDEITRVHTIEFRLDCPGNSSECADDELAFAWHMSADSLRGTLFHGYTDGTGRADYDPPVRLTEAQMRLFESTSTSSGGVDYESTYDDLVECPAPYWRGEKPECIKMDLDGSGSSIAATYWAAYRFGVAAFQQQGSEHSWQLRDFSDEPAAE